MYHRDHIERFIAACNFTPSEAAAIKKRAEDAAAKFSGKDRGFFSGGSLEDVLGSPERAASFNDMWEKQHSVLNP